MRLGLGCCWNNCCSWFRKWYCCDKIVYVDKSSNSNDEVGFEVLLEQIVLVGSGNGIVVTKCG